MEEGLIVVEMAVEVVVVKMMGVGVVTVESVESSSVFEVSVFN